VIRLRSKAASPANKPVKDGDFVLTHYTERRAENREQITKNGTMAARLKNPLRLERSRL
jgi:hypothetical protein